MSSDLKQITLGEFVRLQRGYDLTSTEQVPGPYAVVGSAGPNGTHSTALAKGPGVVVGRSGSSIGRVHFSPKDYWPHNTCLYVTDFLGNDPRFAYYFLQTLNLAGYNSGSAQPSLNRNYVYGMKICVPQRDEQERIVGVLQPIEEQIDLLRETNSTLESIAQAIFKSWFIDFDPVNAKSEGRIPDGIDEATAALFPDSFEESALGAIPRGWSVSTLADHVNADRGLSYKGSGLCSSDEGLPMHNLNSVLEGGDYKYRGIKHYSGEHKEKHLVLAGDIIVANTEQGHDHRLIGFPAIVPASYPKGIFSHHLYRVRLKEASPLSKHFVYYTLMAPAVRDQIISCANGSTVNMLKAVGLEIPRFACPPQELVVAFDGIAAALRAQMEANIAESETLSELRDTLLPRLISGKLKLPELQEAAEAL